MTQIDSGLLRELECVESRELGQAAPKETFLKRGSQLLCWASKEGGVESQFSPTQGGSGIDQSGQQGLREAVARPTKREVLRWGGGDLLLLKVPH